MTTPLFDSATHPTVSGKWLSSDKDASFASLGIALTNENYIGACALGLADINGYSHMDFMSACNIDPRLVPIAGFNPAKCTSITAALNEISGYGYKGIKIHPRLYGIDMFRNREIITETFLAASRFSLTVFLCTYYASNIESFPDTDPYWDLIQILKKAPDTRIVLMHGGMSKLLQYADLARFNENILVDLSYTLIKYQNSSVETDIRYLFETFDQKLCVGSDHPQFTLAQLRSSYERIGNGLDDEKLRNIGYKNLMKFLDARLPDQ